MWFFYLFPKPKPQIGFPSMISAEQFLGVLKKKDLLPKELLASLYNQVAQSQQPVTAVDIAQVLIEGGYLTPALANRLMESGGGQPSQSAAGDKDDEPLELVEDIGFAPLKDETEARPVLGKHRAYKSGDSSKNLDVVSPAPKTSKPSDTPLPQKNPLLDQPPQQRWASSVYDRETDSTKGIVSPRLVKMAGIEQIPAEVFLYKKNKWLKPLIRGGIGLGILVLLYLLFELLRPR